MQDARRTWRMPVERRGPTATLGSAVGGPRHHGNEPATPECRSQRRRRRLLWQRTAGGPGLGIEKLVSHGGPGAVRSGLVWDSWRRGLMCQNPVAKPEKE